ncbi:cytochrome b [Gordonia crocea]|uniref:Cytochrome bc1 complex cytochrome b subunit n=1 Tax=Gordonia crocea TaxID=589162 RepID=A0A7I9V0E3_9ACTN|nr:putative ubiquinol-cytochrome c reductase cytochrome b subunit [Gordonia crocea]
MSRAYETTLNISFEVRGGLFVRQIHHWAALLFAASIIIHMLRIFFTGAFRRPREANWIIGCLLLLLAMFRGLLRYSLPDDLLSGTGVRAAMSGIVLGIPLVGTCTLGPFGGDFPGDIIHPAHVRAAHPAVPGHHPGPDRRPPRAGLVPEAHAVPGPGRTERNVVGVRILPVFAAKAGAFFAITFGVLGIMAGVFQINPVWTIGPYNPAQVSAGSQPDIYMQWTDGLARLMPPWELYLGNYTIPAIFWVVVLIGFMFTGMFAYPWIEKRLTGDNAHHNLLQRPRDVPVRTAIGAMAVSFYVIMTLSCMNDIIAFRFHISLNATTWMGRIGLLVVPPLAYFIAYRWALSLQRSDREVLEHGIETGIIKRLPQGEYIEVHQPLGPVDDHGHPIPLPYEGAAIPKKMNKLGAAGSPGSGGLFFADPPEEQELNAELEHKQHVAEHKALRELQAQNGNVLD